jgi:hypothetical protein
MVDEIRLGTIIMGGTLVAVLGIALIMTKAATSDNPLGNDAKINLAIPGSILMQPPEAHAQDSTTKVPQMNPEQVLAYSYNQSATEEIVRCLGNNENMSHLMCDYTMPLLVKSCADPASYVEACANPLLKKYSPN